MIKQSKHFFTLMVVSIILIIPMSTNSESVNLPNRYATYGILVTESYYYERPNATPSALVDIMMQYTIVRCHFSLVLSTGANWTYCEEYIKGGRDASVRTGYIQSNRIFFLNESEAEDIWDISNTEGKLATIDNLSNLNNRNIAPPIVDIVSIEQGSAYLVANTLLFGAPTSEAWLVRDREYPKGTKVNIRATLKTTDGDIFYFIDVENYVGFIPGYNATMVKYT